MLKQNIFRHFTKVDELHIVRNESTNANPTAEFFPICTVTFLNSERPIMLIAGATVSGVMNLVRNPINPVAASSISKSAAKIMAP